MAQLTQQQAREDLRRRQAAGDPELANIDFDALDRQNPIQQGSGASRQQPQGFDINKLIREAAGPQQPTLSRGAQVFANIGRALSGDPIQDIVQPGQDDVSQDLRKFAAQKQIESQISQQQGLSNADQLAREKFEHEKSREDVLSASDQLAREKHEASQEEEKKVTEKKEQMAVSKARSMIDALDKIEEGKDLFGIGSILPNILRTAPNTLLQAHSLGAVEKAPIPGLNRTFSEVELWKANLDKIISGQVLDVMMELKDASKTGATGFGQLNKEELRTLRTAATTLRGTLSTEDAMKIVRDLKGIYRKVLRNFDESESGGEIQTTASGNTFRVVE